MAHFFCHLKRRTHRYNMLDNVALFLLIKGHMNREFDWPGAGVQINITHTSFHASTEDLTFSIHVCGMKISISASVFAYVINRKIVIAGAKNEAEYAELILCSKPYGLFCECMHGFASRDLRLSTAFFSRKN